MDPGAGIEPALAESEAAVLPLDDPGTSEGGLPTSSRSKTRAVRASVGGMGIEPTSRGLRARCVSLTPTSQLLGAMVRAGGVEPPQRDGGRFTAA